MKISNVEAYNFGSYKEFELDFSTLDLSLVYGQTGSGKSTIPDIITWGLYGQTAKDGAADDIKSWQSPNETTSVSVSVDDLEITRIRGKGKNDLYWFEDKYSAIPKRGKDLVDTQRLLNERLGMDYDTFITSSYFHEFNPTSTFFVAKAKDRRALFEKLADLELPKNLSDKVKNSKSTVNADKIQQEKSLANISGRIDQVTNELNRSIASKELWYKEHKEVINKIESLIKNYDIDKASKVIALKLKSQEWDISNSNEIFILLNNTGDWVPIPDSYYETKLSTLKGKSSIKCDECGQTKGCEEVLSQINTLQLERVNNNAIKARITYNAEAAAKLKSKVNPHTQMLSDLNNDKNTYIDQLDTELAKTNPFTKTIHLVQDIIDKNTSYKCSIETSLAALGSRLSALNTLSDISSVLRAKLLEQAIKSIEERTNSYLDKYFEAENKVLFSANDSDDIEVEIYKSGYTCNYKQLSKGQRGLLKLCFTLSVMQTASDKSGVHSNLLLLDESLDGLDDGLKIRAFSLLQALSENYENILVIDHCESFQNLFTKKFKVTMKDDHSRIEEENA